MDESRKEIASKLLAECGQEHLLTFYEELDSQGKARLVEDILNCNLEEACRGFAASSNVEHLSDCDIRPIPSESYICRKELPDKTLSDYWDTGLLEIVQGKVAVIVLAGGQATRLGGQSPKGMLALGLNVNGNDSLLGLQASKIRKLEKMAAEAYPDIAELGRCKILWYIMTSAATRGDLEQYMTAVIKEHELSSDQVIFFDQPSIPCFDYNGKVLLADKFALSRAPNGNGGLYSAIKQHIPTMRSKGVEYIHVYCVDNILCRVADPHFTGMAVRKNLDCAAKVVEKKEPQEAVGVICQLAKSDAYTVIEYSELSKEMAEKREEEKLAFRAGNIANHLFHIDLLEKAANENHLPYHRANKKIPYIDLEGAQKVKPTEPNGIKMEKFVFDVFDLSKRFCVWEVERSQEFSPFKNGADAKKDTLATCCADLIAEHNRWLKNAGINWVRNALVVSKCSYAGEGLEKYVDAASPGYKGEPLTLVKNMVVFEVPSDRFSEITALE
uniref:UDP-N-acetylglucosamine diphosphorylase n=1 Tax=Steinernema glaseri TaxID=37863 RepID=A0A1I8ADG7_9BILA